MQKIHSMEYYSAMKKEIRPFVHNGNGPGGYYAKGNKLDRERQILHDLIYWNLKRLVKKNKKITRWLLRVLCVPSESVVSDSL